MDDEGNNEPYQQDICEIMSNVALALWEITDIKYEEELKKLKDKYKPPGE